MKSKSTFLTIFLVFFLFGSVFAQDGDLPGDANCDGVVNALDITSIANYFSGNEPDLICFENADVNGDGVINVQDIILTLDIFLGEDPEPGTVTDIDGNVYLTVIIGEQEWMAENLRVTRYNNQQNIPTGLSNSEWLNTTNGAYAIYDDDNIMLEAYGNLYNWYAVDDERGLCPEGWHVPGDDDWEALITYVVAQGYPNEWNNLDGAGNALKSCHQVGSPLEGCNTSEHPRWSSDDTHHGFDEFGFSALPGGYRWSPGSFENVGTNGLWWSAAENIDISAWGMSIHSYDGKAYLIDITKTDGISVRCLRDVD